MNIKLSIFLLAFVFSGCFQQIAVNSLGGIMDDGFEVLNEEQDLQIAQISIASNLKLIETLLRNNPENPHYLLLASMGYSSYSLGFVESDSLERARFLYERGKEYGMRILAAKERFAHALKGDLESFRQALSTFGRGDVPAVFWTAVGWGSAISLNLTDPDAIAELPKVEAMMQFVLREEPSYFHGGAHFFLGTLAGSRPKMLGGNPDSSRSHFEECLKINGGKFLMTYVYYARSYAVQTQDRELFGKCLDKVDSSSIDILPGARLSNAIAKNKAKLLRSKTEELF